MLDLLFIILIFLEIFVLYFSVTKIMQFNKKLIQLNEIVVEKGKIINDMHKKIQDIIKKINFVVSVLTNKKLILAKRIISTTISIIELLIILKSFNFKKGAMANLKNIRKLLLTGLSRQLFKKIFSIVSFVC